MWVLQSHLTQNTQWHQVYCQSEISLDEGGWALFTLPFIKTSFDWGKQCWIRLIWRADKVQKSWPVEQLPVLAGIPPAELRRRAASLALARRAMDPDHLHHHTITREETQPRLKSWRPFTTSGKDQSTTLSNETKAHWIARMWSVEWQLSTSRLREYITSPSRRSPGSDFPQQAWVKLSRLRTGVGRFNADVEMGPIQESSLWLWSRPADSKSLHHGVPPVPSTKRSPWFDWCWCRCSNS